MDALVVAVAATLSVVLGVALGRYALGLLLRLTFGRELIAASRKNRVTDGDRGASRYAVGPINDALVLLPRTTPLQPAASTAALCGERADWAGPSQASSASKMIAASHHAAANGPS